MYSKLYYDERVKPAVEAEIAGIVDQKISRTERFAIVNKHLDEIYEKEPETLKQEVRKAIEELRQAKDTERELSASVIAAEESFGPKEYLLYVLYHLLRRLD
jgi:formate dehydrogenase maturation protein FdhE